MLRITLAQPDDAPLVYRIVQEAFEEYRPWLQPPSSVHDETLEDVRRAFATGGAAVAWEDADAAGAARFQPQADHLYVGRVSVLPAWRGRGIGAALMLFLEGHARALGRPQVQVGVRRALPGNIAFYERLGYRIIDEQPHPRGPQYTSVVMAKDIAP